MKNYPIQKNLNTSTVNLTALVAFLRDLHFVGSVHVELNSYEANITFTQTNLLLAREHDRRAGRISHGDDALQSILLRSKEPRGRINVYQAAGSPAGTKDPVFVDEGISLRARQSGLNNKFLNQNKPPRMPVMINGMIFPEARPEPLPDLTHVFRENEANSLETDWNELLDITAELLRMIDESLEKANFNFPKALENACAIISPDHPFIDPDSGGLIYGNGSINPGKRVSPEIFAVGVTEALKRIFVKLSEEPKFSRVYRSTIIRVRLLLLRRKEQYEKFLIAQRLEEILID